MRNRTRRMTQTATYWKPATDDGLGNLTFPAPVLFAPPTGVRWEQRQELFRDTESREVMSQAVVYVPEPLEIRGYLVEGDFLSTSDPRDVGGREIRQHYTVPNLRGSEQLSKVWL